MDIHGYLWRIHGYPWMILNIFGVPRVALGYPCIIHGQTIHGYLRILLWCWGRGSVMSCGPESSPTQVILSLETADSLLNQGVCES